MMAKRRYKEEFLNVGFTKAVRNGEERPQCVLCGEVLSNESLKMNKLDRHLQTKHPLHRDKSKDLFICKEELFKKQCFDGGKVSDSFESFVLCFCEFVRVCCEIVSLMQSWMKCRLSPGADRQLRALTRPLPAPASPLHSAAA